ncbi:MAG TPA: primosomal protein N' [Burkholderiales bacterium]|nr:primosomal protein N' [Burkholderiales bacterium]
MAIIRVALDVPVPTLFDYRCEDATEGDIGRRALVPFGKSIAIGIIVEITDATSVARERLRRPLRVLRDEPPAFEAPDLELLKFASDYYHHPLGAVVTGALPAPWRRARPLAKLKTEQPRYVLTEAGSTISPEALPKGARLQRRLLERLGQGPLEHPEARALSPRAPRLLREFLARGWVTEEKALDPPAAAGPPAPAPQLTSEQQRAVDQICASLGRFEAHLLLGVTGSGKTEVYLRVIAAALAAGRQALLLVPEIALTPQLEALVRERFPGVPAVSLHSRLAEGERLAHWLAARSGAARIVLGTRLAVFTPLPALGVIVVDEEHDGSFKQAEGFRYSARDLAVVRARLRGIPVVLGSATPSLETYHNAASGRYRLSTLTRRIGCELPRIAYLDTRGERLEDGLSPRLLAALEACCARGEQSLVFINRRGYAPVLHCAGCGWVSGCHRCSAHLVLHLAERRLRCHHCGHQSAVPAACPRCGNPQLSPLGSGTQRVETALARHLPAARILRIDRDSVRGRHAWPEMRRRIRGRDVDVLVGTQILAKGHDFPHLSLVGVINADSLLYSPDIRAPERLFALLTQVAGRAGRAGVQGAVLIQTEFPGHPLYQALRLQDYSAFAETLLAERRAAGFPPFVHQALLRAEAAQLATALEFLAGAARIARALEPRVTIYDPVPAAMPRRAGRARAQLLVQSESRARLQLFLRAWYGALACRRSAPARWALDVDPIEF